VSEAAPPYEGEGPHALWHVSEEAAIARFTPHHRPGHANDEPLASTLDFSGIRLRNATLAR